MFICKEFSNFIQEQMFPKFSLPETQSNIHKQMMLNFPGLSHKWNMPNILTSIIGFWLKDLCTCQIPKMLDFIYNSDF